ncbi:WD40 repeat-like protein [Ramaria rubella]|nr:WD40 repeat-like protein [Ramaria rubella]
MGKHSKKRQRTTVNNDNEPSETEPLGTAKKLADDDVKDEEEKRLEALLFGTTFPSSTTAKTQSMGLENGVRQVDVEHGGELSNLMDSDLFYFNDNDPSASNNIPITLHENRSEDREAPENSSTTMHLSGEDKDPLDAASSDGRRKSSQALAVSIFDTRRPRVAAWDDPDDQNVQVSLASDKRLRKLRDAPLEDVVGGREYEARLRRQYEKVHPAPDWTSIARDRLHRRKRRRGSQSSGSEGMESATEEGITSLLSSSGGLLSSRQQRYLPQGHLFIERLRDANQTAKAEGEIRSVMFHPSPSVPVLLTASADRRLRLFNIDGHTNPHLQSVHIPSLPVTTAVFHPTGSSVLLTGRRPFYYTYDLQSGSCNRSPRGLWGTHATNPDSADLSMETCAFSRTGDILAVAGRRGYVHMVDWRRGGGQVVGTVKMNASVKGVWWTDDGRLMSLGGDNEVYLWDTGERRCLRRWKDDGGFGCVDITGSKNSAYLAIGSNTGLVNLYGPESTSTGTGTSGAPKPLKTIGNLTTSISTMHFNQDAQILALASKTKKDQLKMVHLPSLTVFSNWPTSTTPLGHVTSIDFSPGSEYAAIGNNRGRVLLYNLKHFGSV